MPLEVPISLNHIIMKNVFENSKLLIECSAGKNYGNQFNNIAIIEHYSEIYCVYASG